MEVIQYFHMNGGSGTSQTSYSSNSIIQKKGIQVTKPIIEEAILEIIDSTSSGQNISKNISIAEMGCSSGPNVLLAVSYIIDTIHNKIFNESDGALCATLHPEILVFLNDLSSIDFNIIFKSLHGFYDELKKTCNKSDDADDDQKHHRWFVAEFQVPFMTDSFLATASILFILLTVSTGCLRVLMLSPPGIEKGNIYMAESIPPSVLEAYLKQFERDLNSFLKCRFEEIVKGGRMVLTIFGRADDISPSSDMRCHMWGLLAEALRDMVSQVKSIILTEGSFTINRLETLEVTLGEGEGIFCMGGDDDDNVNDMLTGSRNFVNFMRAISESLMVSHFGEEIIAELYEMGDSCTPLVQRRK